MTSELKPCPLCLRPLKRSYGKFNPMAVCETDGCWMKEKQIAVPCDDPFSVKSWNTRAVPDVPELVRYGANRAEYFDGTMEKDPQGKYVLHSQAAAAIAAKDGRITDYKNLVDALHAKLAQYEAQEPVGYVTDRVKTRDGGHCFMSLHQAAPYINPVYASPAPAADLKAENEKLREALKPFAELAGYYSDCSELDLPAEAIVPNIGDLFKARAALNVEASNDKA